MVSGSFVNEIIKRDKKIFFKDLKSTVNKEYIGDERLSRSNDIPLIADFTEYNPFHNGHLHNLKLAKKRVSDGVFVAILPGLFERSGRGTPYIMTKYARAEIAISLGVDIVVEGPPMGIMGSGQYSLSLALMFQALNADYIPRGYKPLKEFEPIISRICQGRAVAPKPYKIVDIGTGEVLLNGKLEEDNYVIVSLSKSMYQVNFDFKDKFIFIKRIEDVSGTKIRKDIQIGDFIYLEKSIPKETMNVLKREIDNGRAPLHDLRSIASILDSVNNLSYQELISLNLVDEKTAINFVEKRPFNSMHGVIDSISQGFSTHFQNRVLSVLEARISEDAVSEYINNYPSVIRVLNYKNDEVLECFREKIGSRRMYVSK
ncbi:MAG: nucleotidyltransferase family protein [Methanobrevibacter sp.]|jgi:predicted nucleotidyltransferase|nr:nucleotidyltransferase family protein [Candidatus Methanovirga basalitermitum]